MLGSRDALRARTVDRRRLRLADPEPSTCWPTEVPALRDLPHGRTARSPRSVVHRRFREGWGTGEETAPPGCGSLREWTRIPLPRPRSGRGRSPDPVSCSTPGARNPPRSGRLRSGRNRNREGPSSRRDDASWSERRALGVNRREGAPGAGLLRGSGFLLRAHLRTRIGLVDQQSVVWLTRSRGDWAEMLAALRPCRDELTLGRELRPEGGEGRPCLVRGHGVAHGFGLAARSSATIRAARRSSAGARRASSTFDSRGVRAPAVAGCLARRERVVGRGAAREESAASRGPTRGRPGGISSGWRLVEWHLKAREAGPPRSPTDGPATRMSAAG